MEEGHKDVEAHLGRERALSTHRCLGIYRARQERYRHVPMRAPTTLFRGLTTTVVFNPLLTGMIPQVVPYRLDFVILTQDASEE